MGEHDGHRDRMRKRYLKQGIDAFDDHQILELLLFYAIPRRDTNLIAHRLIDTFGSLGAVLDASPDALMQVEGIGESAAALLRLVPETERRGAESRVAHGVIRSPRDAADFLIPRFRGRTEEALLLVCLDVKNRVTDYTFIGEGGPASVQVNTRKIVEKALLQRSSAVILSHNHPGGSEEPSREDLETTRLLHDTLAPLDITLFDHIIVAGEHFFSMAEHNMLG